MPSNSKRPAPMPANLAKQSSTSSSTDIASHPSGSTASDHGSANNTAPKGGAVRASQTGQTGGLPSKDDSTAPVPTSAPSVNRKKQKRREKAAARLAAEQQAKGGYSSATNAMGQNGPASAFAHQPHIDEHVTSLNGDEVREGDEAYYTDDDDDQVYAQPPMESQANVGTRKSRKKKGKKNRSTSHNLTEDSLTSLSTPSSSAIRPPPPPPPLSSAALRSAHKISKDRIWNTSTQEERENIKEFWLQLGEEERRSLVKVEKEAVLRKMKEQQKHSCSCTVCGRKRTAIEEELEVLYDAYYEELEQYANHNQGSFENGAPIVPPPRLYRSPLHTLERHTHPPHTHHPPGMVQELPEDEEEDLEDDYDEDDEDDEIYSDDEFDPANSTRADFFAFGNSLTVKDGILTVADDLLKNDGKHFIDMMEQLAERRMQREEDTQYAAASAAHQSMHANHNHGPPLDEEDYDDEEEEDYDSQEDEEYEEDEMDAMTEEQRMAEGRRMFQIFAARMFEQRVLTAYREKVARERQQKLIEELEEESRQDVQREAKKAREAQKRKDKKRLQKQAKEEEKAKREAEKAAEAAAAKALEERRLEEQRKKKEEQRKKKEAERKAQEEERLRKEAEKQKRLQEERERQAEQERKQRENKEREKKRREEAKKKEREQREAKEKELADKKAKEEQERKAREAETKRQKEPARAERENNERARRDEHAGQPVPQATKRMSQSGSNYLPPGLQHPHGAIQSPHFQVATPVVPKAPTPVRARQASQQGSHASSPRSQPAGTDASQMSVSPGNGASQSSGTSSVVSGKGLGQAPILQHPQPSAPMSPLGGAGRVSHAQNFNPMPALNGIPPSTSGLSGMMPRMPLGHEAPLYSNHPGTLGSQFRGFTSPEGMPMPPGINGVRQGVPGRGFPLDTGHGLPFHPQPHMQAPMSSQQPPVSRETGPQGHTRQPSSSYERSPLEAQGHNPPISRPAPIQRPPSTAPHDSAKQENRLRQSEIDELSTQLGSSALLDDTDIPLTSGPSQPIPTAAPPGAPGSGRLGFGTSPIFSGSLESSKHASFSPLGGATAGNTWGSPVGFPTPGFPGAPTWGPASGTGWSNSAFGVIGGSHRLHQSRPVTIRLLVCQACTRLNANQEPTHHNVNQVLQQVHQQSHTLNPPLEPQISLDEMLDICETEGNSQNGGGSFSIKDDGAGGALVKFDPGLSSTAAGPRGSIAPGDIGSPIPGSSMPVVGGIGTSANSRQFPPTNLSPQTEF